MYPETDTQTLLSACRIVQKQVDKLARHLRKLDEPDDIEQVHQARVACRRLRQAFAFFEDCFEPEHMTNWKKAIKKLLKRLGQARDLDVQAVFLQTFIDSLADDKKTRPGLERLLLRIQQHRQQIQDEVLKAASGFQRKKILINIHLQTEKILFQLRQEHPTTQDALRQRAQEQLKSAWEQTKEREPALSDPQDFGGHHALRIAVKQFRYTLEITDRITGGLLNTFVKTAKKFQTLLGDLHDCVVWQEMLDTFMDDEKEQIKEYCGHTRPFARLKPGIDYLRRDRKQTAKKLYQQACECVTDTRYCDSWQQIFEIISNEPFRGTDERAD